MERQPLSGDYINRTFSSKKQQNIALHKVKASGQHVFTERGWLQSHD